MVDLKKFCRDSLKLITAPSFRSKVESSMLRQQLLEVEAMKKWLEEERKRLEEDRLTLMLLLLDAQAEIRRGIEDPDDLLELLHRLEEDRRSSNEKCRQAEQPANDLLRPGSVPPWGSTSSGTSTR